MKFIGGLSILLTTLLFLCPLPHTFAQTDDISLRAACRVGHEPFSGWDFKTNTCVGFSYDLLMAVCVRLGIPFDAYYWNSTTENALQLDPLTNTSQYNISISYTSVSSESMSIVDFSVPYTETKFVVVLHPRFAPVAPGFVTILLSKPVIYVASVMMLFLFGLGVVYTIWEGMARASEIHGIPWFSKMMYGINHAINYRWEPTNLRTQASRTMRTSVMLIMMFLLNVFSAAITSSITAAAMAKPKINIYDKSLRGTTLMYQELVLTNFLPPLGLMSIKRTNLLADVKGWLNNPNGNYGIDGFVTTVDEARYGVDRFGSGDINFVVSEPFQPSGLPLSKAFAVSKRFPIDILRKINVILRDLHDSGDMQRLLRRYIMATEVPGDVPDIPISATEEAFFFYFTVLGCGLYVLIAVVLYVYDEYINNRETLKKLENQRIQSHRQSAAKHLFASLLLIEDSELASQGEGGSGGGSWKQQVLAIPHDLLPKVLAIVSKGSSSSSSCELDRVISPRLVEKSAVTSKPLKSESEEKRSQSTYSERLQGTPEGNEVKVDTNDGTKEIVQHD